METSRRKLLEATAITMVAGLAGCLDDGTEDAGVEADDPASNASDGLQRNQFKAESAFGCLNRPAPSDSEGGPPLAQSSLPLPDCPTELADARVSGGPGQDGIPSIDDPVFEGVSGADDRIDDGDPVFGIYRDGEAKVYPQNVLVWHEIVNDTIAGDSVAVTYCPLTGTAQGFERGSVEFGVSGQLLNSNLVMYDRGTETLWPQMLATGIEGPLTGGTLKEFPVTWTTWDRWKNAFPESDVLTEDTGYARNYNDDPYGSYNPDSGFYSSDFLMFDPYVDDEEEPLAPKTVVLGARSQHGTMAIRKALLREEQVIELSVGSVPHVAVYNEDLDTGYIYENPEEHEVQQDDGAYLVDGRESTAASLPLNRVLRYDAMWFAWFGYYPTSKVVY